MTLAAIAKQLDVSTMTIYRRLRKAGINLDGLRDSNGEITAAGASVIASLFDAPQGAMDATTDDATECNSDTQHDATRPSSSAQQDESIAAAAQIAILTAQLDAANQTIERIEAERDRLTVQLNAAMAALEREQIDRQNERLLLTGGNTESKQKRGIFTWFSRKK